MNCEVCQLKELEVEHFEIREVLRSLYERTRLKMAYEIIALATSGRQAVIRGCCDNSEQVRNPSFIICGILHTIMFHRALGLVRPKDVDLQLFDITYVQCGDVELEKKIDEKIDQFLCWVEKHPNKKSQICLSFYEVKNNKAMWFSNRVERLYWEHWYINFNVVQHPKAHSSKSHHSKVVDPGENSSGGESARRTTLEASLRDVLFQIIRFVNEKKDHIPSIPSREGISFPYDITIPSSSDTTFGMDMIKRMLQTGHPTMLS